MSAKAMLVIASVLTAIGLIVGVTNGSAEKAKEPTPGQVYLKTLKSSYHPVAPNKELLGIGVRTCMALEQGGHTAVMTELQSMGIHDPSAAVSILAATQTQGSLCPR
jgi:hypothetical protein